MSHYSAMVVGDPEYELAPFHEFECTGLNDEFVQEVDKTTEVLERVKAGESLNEALGWFGLEDKTIRNESAIDLASAHKYGFALIDEKSQLVRAVDRTNPKAKWDSWRPGGRFSDKLLLHDGSATDSAIKAMVDWSEIRRRAEISAAHLWDKTNAILSQHPAIRPWIEIKSEAADIDKARTIYNAQPGVKALAAWNSAGRQYPLGPFCDFEPLQVPKSDYVRQKSDSSITCFAFVKDRQWSERGKMGWWACVTNEKDPETWCSMFAKLLDSVRDDQQLTVVDCHI